MKLDGKRFVVLLTAGSFSALGLCGCRTEVMGAREELAPATRDYMSEYAGKEEDLAALNQRRKEAGKGPYGVSSTAKKGVSSEAGSGSGFEPMETINPAELPKSSTSSAAVSAGGTYRVVAGDNLTKIARKNHTTVSKLAAANQISPDAKLYVGQKLVIPGGSGKAAGSTTPKSATASRPAASAEIKGGLYTVKPGDSIDRIARRTGVKRADLLAANQLTTNSVLRVGQKLVIPGAGSVAAAPAPAAAKPAAVTTAAVTAAAAEKNNPDDTLNSLIKDLGGTEEKSAAPAPQPAAESDDALSTTEIMDDIKVSDFAARYDYSVDQLKAANRDNWPADGIFKAGTLIRLPQ